MRSGTSSILFSSLTTFLMMLLIDKQMDLTLARTATLSRRVCSIDVNRLVVFQNSHVWVCRCFDDEGNEDILGRVEQDLEPFQDTVGHEQAILRCQRRNQQRLLQACQTGSDQFQRTAKPIIQTCVGSDLNRREMALNQPFSFKTDSCGTEFARFISPRTGGVWLCECIQEVQPERSYFVVSGRSAFLTDNSPVGAEEEIASLEECTANAEPRINRVCQATPGDFQLLALQMLEVCCKRARVASDEKFQCRAAVPDDISSLKEPFLM